VVLILHLVGILLQVDVLVGTSRHDLLKQRAHVLAVACHERPTHVVGRKLGVANDGHTLTPHRVALIPNGEQGDGGAVEAQQVMLTELHEGLVGSALQSVIEVVAPSCGEPSHHAWVAGVSWDVNVDLAASTPELMVQMTTVHGSHCVAKVVQHVPEQCGKTEAVQPVATESSIGSEGVIGVVIHLLKIREKQINISSIKQRQQTKTPNKPPQQNSNPNSDLNWR
jgi:hypothetical protein